MSEKNKNAAMPITIEIGSNQSSELVSILCYLPPELPPYQLGKLGNKTPVPLQNIVAEIVANLL